MMGSWRGGEPRAELAGDGVEVEFRQQAVGNASRHTAGTRPLAVARAAPRCCTHPPVFDQPKP
jgi:hypothetical protein